MYNYSELIYYFEKPDKSNLENIYKKQYVF